MWIKPKGFTDSATQPWTVQVLGFDPLPQSAHQGLKSPQFGNYKWLNNFRTKQKLFSKAFPYSRKFKAICGEQIPAGICWPFIILKSRIPLGAFLSWSKTVGLEVEARSILPSSRGNKTTRVHRGSVLAKQMGGYSGGCTHFNTAWSWSLIKKQPLL